MNASSPWSTRNRATRSGPRGERYCLTTPSGTAARAASACAETGSSVAWTATWMRFSPSRPSMNETQSMIRPVTASMIRKGMT